MTSLDRITQPLGLMLWIGAVLLAAWGIARYQSKDTVCALRWNHAVTYSDSVSTARECGSTGKQP